MNGKIGSLGKETEAIKNQMENVALNNNQNQLIVWVRERKGQKNK